MSRAPWRSLTNCALWATLACVLSTLLPAAAGAQAGAEAERARRARAAELVELGRRHREAGDLGSAIGYFRDAVGAWPQGSAPYLALGNAYLARGSATDALAAFEAGLGRRPDDVDLLLGDARARESLGHGARAATSLRRATRGAAVPNRAWRARAFLAQRRGAWLEALSAWRALRESASGRDAAEARQAIGALKTLTRGMDPASPEDTSESPVLRALAESDL